MSFEIVYTVEELEKLMRPGSAFDAKFVACKCMGCGEQTSHSLRWFYEHGPVTRAIFEQYPGMRESFADFFGEDLDAKMPELRDPADLKSLIGLSTVHVSDVAKDGVAYIGFEFGCEWEEEHGLGVMTHRDRIIEVGDSETAFDAWRLRRGEIG